MRHATWAVVGAAMLAALAGQAAAGDDKDVASRNQRVRDKLEMKVALSFKDAPLQDVLKFVKTATRGPNDTGIPIYVDPVGLQEAEVNLTTRVSIDSKAGETLAGSLRRLLGSKGLAYSVRDGLLTITSKESLDEPLPRKPGPSGPTKP